MSLEMENRWATKGVGGAGLGLGIAGTALGLMNGGLGNLFGGNMNQCGDSAFVTRYDAGKDAEIARLETEVKLRDANTFAMGEINKLRDYVDRRIGGIEAQICQQAVVNAQVTSNLACLQNTVATLSGLTKTVIPIDSVCPSVMPQYNSWVAPTATA